MAFCPRCGRPTTEGASYCANCGFDLRKTAIEAGSVGEGIHLVVKVTNVVASGSISGPIDLAKVAKNIKGTEYNPKEFPGLVFRLTNPKTATLIFGSGKLVCTGAKSEEQARLAIQEVVGQLRKRIPIHDGPTISIQNVVATLNYGRWIKVGSIPEGIPDSRYQNGTVQWSWCEEGASFHGRYRKDGTVVNLSSKEEAERLGFRKVKPSTTESEEAAGHPDFKPVDEVRPDPGTNLPVCISSIQSDEKRCLIVFVGGVAVATGAKGEDQVREFARLFERILEEGKLFGPLTPPNRVST